MAALRGLLVDLDGTLYTGGEPVPGAAEAVRRFLEAGVPVRFLTNTTRRSRREVSGLLDRLGLGVREEDIVTPARAAAGVVGDRSCHLLVAESLVEDLSDLRRTEDGPEVVLVGDVGEGFAYENLNVAFRHLMAGADLVALQKNRYWTDQSGLALDAGPFVAALEYAAGKPAAVVGKPERAFFEAALRDLRLPAQEVAVVGDDAEADVRGAQRAGMMGVQVKTGKYRAGDEAAADLVVESFAELPDALGVSRPTGGR